MTFSYIPTCFPEYPGSLFLLPQHSQMLFQLLFSPQILIRSLLCRLSINILNILHQHFIIWKNNFFVPPQNFIRFLVFLISKLFCARNPKRRLSSHPTQFSSYSGPGLLTSLLLKLYNLDFCSNIETKSTPRAIVGLCLNCSWISTSRFRIIYENTPQHETRFIC